MAKVIRYSFYLLFFATPLLFFPWTFELFEFNKMMFVYLMTIIIATAWLAVIVSEQRILLRRTPLDFPILLYLISQILSTVWSIHPHTSLIGYYSRFHGGLLSTISYILLYYAFVTFIGNHEQQARIRNQESGIMEKTSPPNSLFIIHNSQVKTCLNLLLTSATLVAAYGIAEHFGIDKHLWVQDVQRRVFSTLGQPNWLAAFLIMVIPVSLAFFVSSPPARRSFSEGGSPLFLILNSLFYLSLLYTKSRSGILGFALAYFLFWFLLFLKSLFRSRHPEPALQVKDLPHFPVKKFIILNSLFIILSLHDGLSWLEPVNRLRQRIFQPSALSIEHLAPVDRGEGGTESGEIRKIVWKGAVEIWKHYPYFGSGVETFAYSYYNFRPVEHNLVSEWDFLYNKAHNEYLNLLATTGIVGLGSYVLLQLWIVIWLLKSAFAKKQLSIINYQLSIALIASYAGVSVSNFFGFSTVTVGLFMFLFPAIAVVISQPSNLIVIPAKAGVSKNIIHPSSSQKILLVLVLFASGYTLFALTKWYYADTQFAKGKRYADAGYLAEAYPLLATAVNLLPQEPAYHNELSSATSTIAVAFHNKQATDSAQQVLKLAVSESNLTQTQNPVHVNFVKTRARVMFTLAEINPIFLSEAENTLLRGLQLSPTDAKLMYNLALLYQQTNQPDKALTALEKTVALKSNYEAARQSLGATYEDYAASTSGTLNQEYRQKAITQYEYILQSISPKNSTVRDKLQKLKNVPALP